MTFNPKLSPQKQIKNLLFVLCAGIACAILLTLFMLYNYGPQGHYLLKNTLLAPETITQISPSKTRPNGTQQTTFDKIEFSYQDSETHKRVTVPVNSKSYNQFYQMIANDKSLLDIPPEVTADFNQMPPASLVISIQKNDKNEGNQKNTFQEVQLLYKGDYYRLQLRESGMANWIYFYHPHIYDDAFTVLNK